jgi:micrococcal nuclease
LLDQLLGYLMDAARWTIIFVLSMIYPDAYNPWTGTVVEIVRPDEIRVTKSAGEVETVRLYGIDSPLEPQDFAEKAMSETTIRVSGKLVEVQPLPGKVAGPWYRPTIDRYDPFHRTIALVSIDGVSLNREMLRNGLARWYRPFVPFERGFKRLEDEAREAKVGMWCRPSQVAPWRFQHTPIERVHPLLSTPARDSAVGASGDPEPPAKENQAEKAASGARPGRPDQPPRLMEAPVTAPPEVDDSPAVVAPENTCEDKDYEARLKRAYTTAVNAASAHFYVARQIANNWESRQALRGSYGLGDRMLSQAEQVINEAANPCRLYEGAYDDVLNIWKICGDLRSLLADLTDDQTAYQERLQSLSDTYGLLVTKMSERFNW